MTHLSYPNFSTITKQRAMCVGPSSPVKWLQFFVTGDCQNNCQYCKRFGNGSKPIEIGEITESVRHLNRPIEKIKLTGGEPTDHPQIIELIKEARHFTKEISIGTHGRIDKHLVDEMFAAGLTSATVSVDCSYDNKPLLTIWRMSKLGIRAVAGITVDESNMYNIQSTIDAAIWHDADDCTISVSTHSKIPPEEFDDIYDRGLPILSFRLKKAREGATRGKSPSKCYMCLDSMAVKNGEHYPCQIYMRESGKPIGKVSKSINDDRQAWHETHDCQSDPICSQYCPDFCIEFNNECQRVKP